MLHLTRMIDKATGCVFVPPANSQVPEGAVDDARAPPTQRPNEYSLMSSVMGPVRGPRSDVRDVQERWIDARDEYDAFEKCNGGKRASQSRKRQGKRIRSARGALRRRIEMAIRRCRCHSKT